MGGKRRCEKGKPCGATCIDRREICRKELSDNVSDGTGKVSTLVNGKTTPKLDKLTTPEEFEKKLQSTEGNYSPQIKEMHDSSKKLLGEDILAKSWMSAPSYSNKEEEEKFQKLRQSLLANMAEKDVSEAVFSLRNYTAGKYGDYRNAQLGRTNSPDNLKRAQEIEQLIRSKEFERPEVEKFRGKRVDNQTLSGMVQSARMGGTFSDRALASWSTDLDIAQTFADKNTGRNNRVILRAVNKNGVPIGSISMTGYEREILTPSGSNYRYLGYSPIKVGSRTYHVFDVEES